MSDWAEATLKDGRVVRIEVEAIEGLEVGAAFTAHRDSHGTLWAAPYEALYSWEHLDPKSEAYEAKDWGRFASEVEAGEYD